ncbi:unnamed protein product [Mytilus coruscus]|uniref:AAA+ ATPase domain-containing protein n=1 Tax=Mytilus coruscus TaxID=42192 RepID=A0A6J8DKG3_MYTCO|nr:unnamed protein product [Mytilus coruscus]
MSNGDRTLLPFQTPCSILIVGPTQSGKTMLTFRIIKQAGGMFSTPPVKIVYCYSVYQELFASMEKEIDNITFHEGLPSSEQVDAWSEKREHMLLILDDLLATAVNDVEVLNLFTWDKQGEVCIDGKVISNTHIVDLIRDSTVPIGRRKLTAGIHQFCQFLKSTNIPHCLFRNVEQTNIVRFESTPYKEKKTEEENKEKEETDEYSEDSDNEYIQRNKKAKKTETNLETQKKMYVQRDINSIFTTKKKRKKWLQFK